MLMLGKNSPRRQHAHAFANAWSSVQTGTWLENNYGYGHSNARARPTSKDLISALKLNTPSAITEPHAHIDRDIPRRALYARMWEEVKAS
jgi:hypothetical protein